MSKRVPVIQFLLFCSGICALIYQIGWLRELRLVFGASTAASAAVLAIFMGGLGLGSALLGKRADRHPAPLKFYGCLQLIITLSAFLSPFLISLARQAYIGMGGAMVLGTTVATILRLILSSLVLAIPTIAMGGTLPAAVKAASSASDQSRRSIGLLYGANTIGAVVGAVLATFFLLEMLGTRCTIWAACALNLLIALLAISLPAGETVSEDEDKPAAGAAGAPFGFVLFAAAAAGFSFFLLELVWYRMLGPLLGGSSYTFGLILAVALLGIGLGGLAYSMLFRQRPATLAGFAVTCGCEALLVAIPFALGDRIAILAGLLRPLGTLGIYGDLFAWSIIAGIVILPAAFVSGIQFPLIIGLLGKGGDNVGRQTGLACAWNTVGAIAGSLAGGFGILPLLTAPVTWQLVVVILALLGGAALFIHKPENARSGSLLGVIPVLLAFTLLTFEGPTAAWRHVPIGAGRENFSGFTGSKLRDWQRRIRRNVFWEAEGVESSVAMSSDHGINFIVNGKVDGNARGDAETQIMLGILAPIFHPNPERGIIIGLGTGESAGWMAKIPTMRQVDVVEIEPAIDEVARVCAPMNHNVMTLPNVQMIYNDAREVLLTAPDKYDVIVSEPSNPYRAGIASLYTREFYAAAESRLTQDGIFCQWVQAYEVDTQTVRTIFATLREVFPHVEVWQANFSDMLILCSRNPIQRDAAELRAKIDTEPYRSALLYGWNSINLESLLAHHVSGTALVSRVHSTEVATGRINTDDRTLVEYDFARTVGRMLRFDLHDLWLTARRTGCHRPVIAGTVDWELVDDARIIMGVHKDKIAPDYEGMTAGQRYRAMATRLYIKKQYTPALSMWKKQQRLGTFPLEVLMLGECLARSGSPASLKVAAKLRGFQPIEADVIEAFFYARTGKHSLAADRLARAFTSYRKSPWPHQLFMAGGLKLAEQVTQADSSTAGRIFESIRKPFSVYCVNATRLLAKLHIAAHLPVEAGVEALDDLEPHTPWRHDLLSLRVELYSKVSSPRLPRAQRELEDFLSETSKRFSETIPAEVNGK